MGIVKEQWFMGWYARGFHIVVLRTKTRKPHTIHSGADGRRGLSSGFAHGHTHSPRALGPIEREQDSHPTTPTQKGSQKYTGGFTQSSGSEAGDEGGSTR